MAEDWAIKTSGPVSGGEYSSKYHAGLASTSATSANNAKTAAEAARDQTLAVYDSFDDRYLGTKASDPTVDNDGDPLVAGSLYFNSVSGVMRLYTGSAWVAAYVSGTASGILNTPAGNIAATNVQDALNELDNEKLPVANPSYTGTLTGGTGVINIGSGQVYKDASGNVGIGTSSPRNSGAGFKGITLDGSSSGFLDVNANGTRVATLFGAGNDIVLANPTATGIMAFQTNATECMRINSSGNVGIGTSSLGGKLDVAGSTSRIRWQLDTAKVTSIATNAAANAYAEHYFDASFYTFNTNATERMRIDASGNLLFNSGYGSVATAYGCRAWVNFNGTGTVAIRESGNVSSITDNGAGDYTVNFTTAMPDSNYSAVVTGISNSTTDLRRFATISGTATTGATSMTTTELNVISGNGSTGTKSDLALINVAIFR